MDAVSPMPAAEWTTNIRTCRVESVDWACRALARKPYDSCARRQSRPPGDDWSAWSPGRLAAGQPHISDVSDLLGGSIGVSNPPSLTGPPNPRNSSGAASRLRGGVTSRAGRPVRYGRGFSLRSRSRPTPVGLVRTPGHGRLRTGRWPCPRPRCGPCRRPCDRSSPHR
jgi:hypothetical protein